jgi:hypothetical protein
LACGKTTNKYIITLKINRMEQLTTEEKEFIFISLLIVEKKDDLKYNLNTRQKHILKNLKYKLFKN